MSKVTKKCVFHFYESLGVTESKSSRKWKVQRMCQSVVYHLQEYENHRKDLTMMIMSLCFSHPCFWSFVKQTSMITQMVIIDC